MSERRNGSSTIVCFQIGRSPLFMFHIFEHRKPFEDMFRGKQWEKQEPVQYSLCKKIVVPLYIVVPRDTVWV